MVVLIDDLILQILKRFSYVGNNCCSIIDDYEIKDEVFPNVENVKRVCELKDLIKKNRHIQLEKEEMEKVFALAKDTLIKIKILNK